MRADRESSGRITLRVIVIAGVIVLHAATAYLAPIAGWYYEERTSSGVWLLLLSGPASIGALFALGPLFLLAGWFSAASLARRGPGGFARSRLLRLGAPLVVYVLLIDPLTAYLGGGWRCSPSACWAPKPDGWTTCRRRWPGGSAG